MTRRARGDCGDFQPSSPYEPNDDFAGAWHLDPIPAAGIFSYVCSPTDDDYFSFAAVVSDEIVVQLSQLPANYDLELFDPTGALVASARLAGTDAEELSFRVSNFDGDYRIRVFGPAGEFDRTTPYHLAIHVVPYDEPVHLVNTTDDADDGSCDSVHCSLREAFAAINAGAGRRVEFDMPGSDPGFDGSVWTIRPASALPTLTRPVELNGASQTTRWGDTNPQGPEVVLDGGAAGTSDVGIELVEVIGATLSELVISDWDRAGIRAERCVQLTVHGCFIGTSSSGTGPRANGDGIQAVGGHSHRIGGTGDAEGNLLSGNDGVGIRLHNTAYVQVLGNLIGTDRAGSSALPNEAGGVLLIGTSEYNRIGDSAAGAGNVISGNFVVGVDIRGGHHNRVYGNTIGSDVGETARLGNRLHGVRILDSDYNEIGGPDPGQGNLIAGNLDHGVVIENATLNTVAGNRIGTISTSGVSLGNAEHGVHIRDGASNNTIGPDNTIANNGSSGVAVSGGLSDRNTITRNSIFDNLGRGILLTGSYGVGNDDLPPPIISASGTDFTEGTACPSCTVEIFDDNDDEGELFKGSVIALATGRWRWDGYRDRIFTRATTTDSLGNTSGFTDCFDAREPNEDLDTAYPITSPASFQSFICSPQDLDAYRVFAPAGSTLRARMQVPTGYSLRLFGPDHGFIDLAPAGSSPSERQLIYTVTREGDYYLVVAPVGDNHDPDDPYTLSVEVGSINADVRLFLDQGSILAPAVHKLIPDYTAPSDATLVDVVAEVTADASEPVTARVTIRIPDDIFGSPIEAVFRQDEWGPESPAVVTADGTGGYLADLILDNLPPPVHGQLVLRFRVRPWHTPRDVVPSAEVRLEAGGEVVAATDGPAIRLVHQVPAIIITSRHHLYETGYDPVEAMWLLSTVTWAAQGPPEGAAGGLPAAIYFVDDYSTRAEAWDNLTWDPDNEAIANQVARSIDDLLDDWIDDAVDVDYVLIVGDDDVVPLFRRKAPCAGSESDHPEGSDPAVVRLVSNDYLLTDNIYGDTDRSGWSHGELEVDVGRLVGDTARDLRQLFDAGLSGPEPGPSPRAVLASWDGSDLDFTGGSGVLDHVRDWGYSASSALVDNADWRTSDLLDALSEQFTLFIHADHGNTDGACTPGAGKSADCANGAQITDAVVDADALSRNPFSGFGDCRVGLTLTENGLIDQLISEGFSGAVANAGISFSSPEGTEWFTEEVFNRFWRQATADRSVGRALRRAKRAYSPTMWHCWDRTAVQEITLYGVPWMRIPRGVPLAEHLVEPEASGSSFGPPVAVGDGVYSITAVVDASRYSIDSDSAPGFDLVEVDGCEQRLVGGPVLPAVDVRLLLPVEAEVESVELTTSSPAQLGALRLPSFVPGVLLFPNGSAHRWEDIDPAAGTVPSQPLTWQLLEVDEYQELHAHIIPRCGTTRRRGRRLWIRSSRSR